MYMTSFRHGASRGTVSVEALRAPRAYGKRAAALRLVEAPRAVVGLNGLRESQFGNRSIGMHLSDEYGVHASFAEHGTEALGFGRNTETVVAVGSYGVNPLPCQKRGAARYAERRRAVGVLEQCAVVGEPLHVRSIDEVVAVGRRVPRIVLVGHEDDDVGHDLLPVLPGWPRPRSHYGRLGRPGPCPGRAVQQPTLARIPCTTAQRRRASRSPGRPLTWALPARASLPQLLHAPSVPLRRPSVGRLRTRGPP